MLLLDRATVSVQTWAAFFVSHGSLDIEGAMGRCCILQQIVSEDAQITRDVRWRRKGRKGRKGENRGEQVRKGERGMGKKRKKKGEKKRCGKRRRKKGEEKGERKG